MARRRKSDEHAAFLAGSNPDETAEALHAYAKGSEGELAADAREAARTLHAGTPADVISLADRAVEARAREAARRLIEHDGISPDAA